MEDIFESLRKTAAKPPARLRRENAWISSKTWSLVDKLVSLRRQNRMGLAEGRRLQREIRASIKADRAERAKLVGEQCKSELRQGNVQEAFRHLSGWYRAAGEVASRPCFETLEKQTQDREALYGHVPPPGESIPINVDPRPIVDSIPPDKEIRDVVRGLKKGRAGGTSKICAENIKSWLRGAVEEEDPELTGREGAGDNWRLFVKLIQAIWENGEVPRQLHWVIVVLIPKGGGGYRGIGLLEPIWKVIEVIMDKRLNDVEFHDSLHGFRAGRGTGTAIIEAKLAQQLAFREQAPLYGVFIDLRKAFDLMDRGRCLEVLAGYGAGPRMLRLIKHF